MGLAISQMREKIAEVYSSDQWKQRVKRMPNDQVIAIYYRMLQDGRIKDAG